MDGCPNDGPDGEAGVRAGASAPGSGGVSSLSTMCFIHPLGLEAAANSAMSTVLLGSLGWCSCPSLVQPCAGMVAASIRMLYHSYLVLICLYIQGWLKKKLCFFPECRFEGHTGLLQCLQ